MRRLVAVSIALLLVLALAPAAAAAPTGTTTKVSSEWTWVNTGATFTDLPDGSIRFAGTESGTFTGTFKGTSYDVFEILWLPPTDDPEHWGASVGSLTAEFKGWVGGKRGAMTIYFTIWSPPDGMVYSGTWVTMSGTAGLKHVSGSGTWLQYVNEARASMTGTITWK
jgi:hypothetical protein